MSNLLERIFTRRIKRRLIVPPAHIQDPKLEMPEGCQEFFDRIDTNGDGFVSPLDALLVINQLNEPRVPVMLGQDQEAPPIVTERTMHAVALVAIVALALALLFVSTDGAGSAPNDAVEDAVAVESVPFQASITDMASRLARCFSAFT